MTIDDFHNPDFSLRQLQYAIAVQHTGGFGTAAEACGVSQPSLSVQVAKLEDALGVVLFERHARGVLVTTAGAGLLAQMKDVLAATRRLQEASIASRDPYAVPLRIGLIPTVAPYLLPAIVEGLQALEPRPIVHWLELQTSACEEALEAGELDAMLIAEEPGGKSGLEGAVVGWEPFCVLVPDSHALRGPASLGDVAADAMMLLDDGHCLRDQTLALCRRPEARRSPYRATSLPTLVQMVGAGLGISVLPTSAVAVEVPRAAVRVVPFTDPGIGRSLHLIWRPKTPREPLLVEVAAVMARALQQVLA